MNFKTTALALAAFAFVSLGATASAQDTTAAAPAAAAQTNPAPAATTEPAPAEAAAPAAATSETTSATVGAPPAGKGMVVIFRPSRFVGAALAFTAREGETVLGSVGNGHYLSFAADPGDHAYNIRGGETVRIEVEAGETSYLQLNIAMGLMSGRGVLAPSTKTAFEENPLQPSRDQAGAAATH